MKIERRLPFVMAAMLAFVLACSTGTVDPPPTPMPPSDEEPQYGGTLRIVYPVRPAQMNVHKLTTGADDPFLYLIYDGMVGTSLENRSVISQMTESWDIANAGKEITFRIRKGIRFHDGTAFDANAAKWNIDEVVNAVAFVGSKAFRLLKQDTDENGVAIGPQRVQAPDDYTLQLNLKETFAPIMPLLALRGGLMMSQQAVTNGGENYAQNPVGAGPFQFKGWIPGNQFTVERFPGYWDDGAAYLDEITILLIPDDLVSYAALRTGDIHVGPIPWESAEQEIGLGNLKMYPENGVTFSFLNIDSDVEPTNDIRVRRAISLAIDRQAISDVIWFGKARVKASFVSQDNWAYNPNLPPPEYDTEKARQLLRDSGYDEGLKLRMVGFTVVSTTGEAIKSMLAEVGIDVEFDNFAIAAAIGKWFNGGYQLANFTADDPPDPHRIMRWFNTGFGPLVKYHETYPELGQELTRLASVEAVSTVDLEQRKTTYFKMQELINENVLLVPLVQTARMLAARPEVMNYPVGPDNRPWWRQFWLDQR